MTAATAPSRLFDGRHGPAASVAAEIYLDHAATAPLHPHAAQAMQAAQRLVGNPSSRHGAGRDAAEMLADARRRIAALFGVDAEEVVLTSGGSESNALALWGTFAALGFTGHLVTTAIEHPAVLANAHALRDLGVAVTLVDPAPSGHVDPADVARALRADTALVSVMHANNETGALQPITEIAAHTRRAGVALHVDAVHTAGKLDLTVLDATMMSVSAHKFGGPRGVGALAVRHGHRLAPVLRGGSQEHGLRAGTENVPGAVGMAAAVDVCRGRMSIGYRRAIRERRRQLIDGLRTAGGVQLTATEPVLEETVSLRFDGVRADTVADELDLHGIYVSTGSACHAGADTASHVLRAMRLTDSQARATVRFSLGPELSAADVDRVIATTVRAVRRLRGLAGTAGGR